MRMNLKTSLAAAALVLTPVVAGAADMKGAPARTAPQFPAFYDWSGLYAGGHVGVGWAGDDDSGIFGGGQVGFNYQIGQWVLGVEGELATTSTNIDWISTLSARAGWTFDRWLVYGKLGGAWANVDTGYSDKTFDGLLLGVGAEYVLQGNWRAKVEYDMMDFGNHFRGDDNVHVFKAGLNYGFAPLPGATWR